MKNGIIRLQKNNFFLKSALAITGVFLVIVVFLMLFIGYQDIKNSKLRALENVDKSIKSFYLSSDEFLNTYYLQLTKILVDSNVELFGAKNYNEELFLQKGKNVTASLAQGKDLLASVDSIYLYSKYKNYILTSSGTASKSDFKDMSWLKEINNTNNELKIFYRNLPESGNVLTITYTLDNSTSKNITGVMNIDLSKHMERYLNESYDVIFFNREEGKIYYKSNNTISNSDFITMLNKIESKSKIIKSNGKYYAVSIKKSSYKPFSYAVVQELENYGSDNLSRILVIFLASFALIALIMFMFFYYADTSYRPILGIADILEHPSSQVSKKYLESDATTKKIAENILFLVSTNEKLENELGKKTKIFEYTQLKALQWQMNPHFIFNTLNMLHLMSLDKNADRELFSSAILSLARLMRYYLKTEKMVVTLREEKEMTEEYIRILYARNGDNFEIEWDIDSTLYEECLTKMCLQPILENCFKHGICTDNGKPKVKISAKRENGFFTVTVDDNCSQITKEKTDEINKTFKKGTDIPENHIGLNNINARIMLMYGNNYGITVKNHLPKNGLTVNMRFPL